jgi:hypothetical protein
MNRPAQQQEPPSNAAQQITHDNLEDISDEEWEIIGTSSVNSDATTPTLSPAPGSPSPAASPSCKCPASRKGPLWQ